jgi:hypothetical protein
LPAFCRGDSEFVLGRCHEAFGGRSQSFAGFIALPRGSYYERSATRNPDLCDGGGNGKLAEPGQNWNATDVITDPTLPGERLIWAAVGGEYYVVHYERGGIDHRFHILVMKLTKNDAKKVIWRAVGGPFKDYRAFLDALRNGKLDDRLDYPH